MDWQAIQESFRGTFEGALWGFILLVLVAFGLPIVWHLSAERLQRRRRLLKIRRRLRARGLGQEEWRLLESAIQAVCPEHPSRLFDSLSLFHSWMDGLPDLEQSPDLMATLARIKELAYPDSHHIFVPHSTRDLVAGVSLNLVLHRGGQEIIPCIVTEVSMEGLRLGRRGSGAMSGAPGEQVSLFYPRPEAMYHALVRLQSVAGSELRTSHTLQGNFKVRQLREFWRVDVDMELPFLVFAEPGRIHDPALTVQPDMRQGRLINLSGNGAAIVTTTPPPRGSRIAFTLQLPSRTLHDLHAEILHITPNREISRLHLVFRDLDPGDQELIIHNLFLLYREQVGMDPVFDSGPVIVQNRH